MIGWLNRKMFEETGDEVRSQGWTPFVVDTNGNGRRDAYVEPGQPTDPAKDTRVAVNTYAVAVSPADGSVWGTVVGYRGYIVRVVPGSNPTETALTEIYEPPRAGLRPARRRRRSQRRVLGVAGQRTSGELRSPQVQGARREPTATGAHCPEGWTFSSTARAAVEGRERSRERGGELLHVGRLVRHVRPRQERADRDGQPEQLDPRRSSTARFINFTLPYPMGFFAKNVDGRIDNPNAGWKGSALWSTYGTRTMFHLEGGTANRPKAVKIQVRPDPLAR